MTPAELLFTARRRRGLTQAALAQRAGTSQPVISAYEHGRRDPTTATLRRLIGAAGGRLELRLGTDMPEVPPPATLREHADRLLDVLSLVDAVPARRRSTTLQAPRMVSSA
jgi:transcriptional regulator with XRE-family HTH domain